MACSRCAEMESVITSTTKGTLLLVHEDKFIVYWSCLLPLLKLMACSRCGEMESVITSTTKGTLLLVHEDKFIVYWSCLLPLLKLMACSRCAEMESSITSTTKGTLLLAYFICRACQFKTQWKRQPYVGNMPAGNISLSTAILTADAVPSKMLRVLSHMQVAAITTRTFSRYQRSLLLSAIRTVWADHQTWLMASLRADDRSLVLGGDGHCDYLGQ